MVTAAEFKDHFSAESGNYAQYRPTYPDELFEFLGSIVAANAVAWDCATGSGQAAIALADHFEKVIASDASQSQIDAAIADPRVEYRVASAEQSGLADHSVDLLTVGQAFHWFDETTFLAEAQRILKPDGMLAIWCYELCHVAEECDAIVDTLYRDIVGEYWPPERVTIEQGYSRADLPGEAVAVPTFEMSSDWRSADMLGYLRTWSACKRYAAEKGSDPVALLESQLVAAWGDQKRRVIWPMHIKVSRTNTLLE